MLLYCIVNKEDRCNEIVDKIVDKNMDKIVDKNIIKKIMTFKSGKFVFSYGCKEEILELLMQTTALYMTIQLPILPELIAQIEEELILKSIFGTAAIEGNPLKEADVEMVLSEEQKTEKLQDAQKQIKNLKEAYNGINNILSNRIVNSGYFPISEEIIKTIHYDITKGLSDSYNIPGQYRNHLVKVGNLEHGGVYIPPKIAEDIKWLMKEFCAWINSDEVIKLGPQIRAALAHYHLGLIHPFGNGNGRTARLIEALILLSAGIKYVPLMLSNFYYRNIDEYFLVFSQSRNKENDVTPFLKFMLRGMIESLMEIRDKIISFIRISTIEMYVRGLMDKKKISQRQLDLLLSQLRIPNHFGIEDLFDSRHPLNSFYRKVSKKTALRDLYKLVQMNLIKVENKKYALNITLLG